MTRNQASSNQSTAPLWCMFLPVAHGAGARGELVSVGGMDRHARHALTKCEHNGDAAPGLPPLPARMLTASHLSWAEQELVVPPTGAAVVSA